MPQSSQPVSRSLDFNPGGVEIKQENNNAFNLPEVKRHFPGTKKATYKELKDISLEQRRLLKKELQEHSQSKKRKSAPSHGRAPARSGFGSPAAKQAKIAENYKDMTDTKQKIIAVGTEVLKKGKCKELWFYPCWTWSYGSRNITSTWLQLLTSIVLFWQQIVNSSILHEVNRLKTISSTSFWPELNTAMYVAFITFYSPQSLGQCNVFTPVCHSLDSFHHSGWYASYSNAFLLKLQIIRNRCLC